MDNFPQSMTRELRFSDSAVNAEARTVRVAFSSEEPIERAFGFEVLGHRSGEVDTSRMRGAAVLHNHDTGEHIGVVEDVEIGPDRRGRALLRFGRGQRASEIFQDIEDGIRRQISVGYELLGAEQSGERDGVPVYRFKWRPFEVSVVSVAADASVGVGRSREDMNMSEADTETQGLNRAERREREREHQQIAKDERRRIAEIEAVWDKLKDQGLPRGFVERAIEQGTDFRKFQVEADEVCEALNADFENVYKPMRRPVRQSSAEMLRRTQGINPYGGSEVGMSGRELEGFSLKRFLEHVAEPEKNPQSFELGICNEAARAAGRSPRGYELPMDVLNHCARRLLERQRRDLTVGTNTAGGHLKFTERGEFIDLLRSQVVVFEAGAQEMVGLVGDLAMPKQTAGSNVSWVGEGGDVSEANPTFDRVTMSPKTVGTFVDISRKLLIQSTPAIEDIIFSDIVATIARETDRVALEGNGVATSGNNEPTGVLYTSGIGTAGATGTSGASSLSQDLLVDLWTEVAQDNADLGRMGYIMNPQTYAAAAKTKIDTGSGRFLLESRDFMGMPVWVTSTVPADLNTTAGQNALFFGSWNQLVVGYWSGIDFNRDTVTLGRAGGLRLIAHIDMDVAVRHAQSFSVVNDLEL